MRRLSARYFEFLSEPGHWHGDMGMADGLEWRRADSEVALSACRNIGLIVRSGIPGISAIRLAAAFPGAFGSSVCRETWGGNFSNARFVSSADEGRSGKLDAEVPVILTYRSV